MKSFRGKSRNRNSSAPPEYEYIRYKYIDGLLERVKRDWKKQDVDRLSLVYEPIIERIKNSLIHHYGNSKHEDIKDAVYTEFMHMIQLYDLSREKRITFSNFLKNYFSGWCFRFMDKIEGSRTKPIPQFYGSRIETDDYIEVFGVSNSNYSMSSIDPYASSEIKDLVSYALDRIRKKHGEKISDIFMLSYVYNFTQNEISLIVGCTQAKISQILQFIDVDFRKILSNE